MKGKNRGPKKYGRPIGPICLRIKIIKDKEDHKYNEQKYECINCGERFISHQNYLYHKKKCDKEVEIWGCHRKK